MHVPPYASTPLHSPSCGPSRRRGASGSGLRVRFGLGWGQDEALFGEQPFEFAVLVHLEHGVAPAHELAGDVDLRDRRPVPVREDLSPRRMAREAGRSGSSRKLFDAFPELLVLQAVVRLDLFRVHPMHLQQLHDGPTEPALRIRRGPLHEEDERVGVDGGRDLGPGVGREQAQVSEEQRVGARGGEERRSGEGGRGGGR